MYNIIILGSGRSGTSLAAGLFNKAGYYMGDDLYDPNPANPKGFFENEEINLANEDILLQVLPRRPKCILGNVFFSSRPGEGQMWLARLPLGKTMRCPDKVKGTIRALVAKAPFCFKDPRFSYTLPCWQPMLQNTRYLVVFRSPCDTVKSILKECKDASYLHNLSITRNMVLETWQLMYSHILTMPRKSGEWLFMHYDQMLTPAGLDRLETFARAKVDRSFPEKLLKRSISCDPVPEANQTIYNQLCQLAGYQG